MAELHESKDWNAVAEEYSGSVGRVTFDQAYTVVDMANKLNPISESSRVIDLGAGTGAVTLAVKHRFPNTFVLVADNAESMLDQFKQKNCDLDVQTKVIDAENLQEQVGSTKFTHILSNFMLQFITTDTTSILRQMFDSLTPGGVVGIGIWGPRIDAHTIFERACQSVDSSFVAPPPFQDADGWRTEKDLKGGLQKAGFSDITVITQLVHFPWDSAQVFTDFWFGATNPGALKIISAWKGDRDAVCKAMHRIIDTEYDGGRGMYVSTVFGVGKRL